jgi:hypothetical protein
VTYGRLTELSVGRRSAWVFGIAPSAARARPTAILWRGGAWRRTIVPLVGVSGLVGGDVRRDGLAWAVGFRRPGAVMEPIALRWRHGRWRDTRVPDPAGRSATLSDAEILPSGSVWAVGSRLEGGRMRPLVLEYDGAWRQREPTLEGPAEAGLTAVAAAPSGSLWAVGWQTGPAGTAPWILRHNDGAWAAQAIEGLPGGEAVLTDVAVESEDRAWAVGYLVPADGTRFLPLLLGWDGLTWSPTSLPWADEESRILHGVAADGQGELLLTGARVARNNGRNRAFVATRSDGAWQRSLAPASRYHNSELTDGDWVAGQPLLVGASATQVLVVRSCRAHQSRTRSGPPSRPPDAPSRPPAPAPTDTSGQLQPVVAARATRSPVFRDVARRAGLAGWGETWGVTAADFDADGWTDVFLGRHNRQTPKLMLGGRGGRFTRTAPSALRLRDRHGCAAGDVDADGLPDLFCSIGANRGTNMTSNELWLAVGTREHRQATADAGLNDPFGRGRVAAFMHLDADPYPELFVGNEPQRSDSLPSLGRFYRNDTGRRFLSAPQQGLDTSLGATCATAGDIDADGDEDLLVCASQPWAGLPSGLRVFRNEDGQLRHATRTLGITPIGDADALLADLDGDGRADDLVQLGSGGLRVSIGGRAGQVLVHRRPVTFGLALAAGDVDGDGRDDLYVQRGGSGNEPDLLLVGRRDGRDWVSRRIPQARGGLADDVVTLDHDHNGLADFLVTNGRMSRGPVQLIAAYRR